MNLYSVKFYFCNTNNVVYAHLVPNNNKPITNFTSEAIAFTRKKQKEQILRVEEMHNKLKETQGKRYLHAYKT